MSRYQGFSDEHGIAVLDTATGEVVYVPFSGEAPRSLYRPSVGPVSGEAPPELAAARAASGEDLAYAERLPEREALGSQLAGLVAQRGGGPAPLTHASAAFGLWAGSEQSATSAKQDGLPEGATAFDHEVVATYPTPLGRAYAGVMRSTDAEGSAHAVLRAGALTLKLQAIQIASEALRVESDMTSRLLTALPERAPFGIWADLVRSLLPVLQAEGFSPFIPEVSDVWPRLLRVSKDEERSGGAVSTLGRLATDLEAGQGFERTLQPAAGALVEILDGVRYWTRYPLYAACRQEAPAGQVVAWRMMGVRPETEPRVLWANFEAAPTAFFLHNEASDEVLPLPMLSDAEPFANQADAVDALLRL